MQTVNLANKEGNTPLHWACVNNQKQIVVVLLQAGASASALNIHEMTPVDEALNREYQDIVDLINEYTTGSGGKTGDVDDIPDDDALDVSAMQEDGDDAADDTIQKM